MNRAFKGIWIPKEIWEDDRLGWTEKLLLVEIDSLDNKDGCWATNEYFAKFFKLSKDRVSKLITELRKKGYITVELIYKPESKQIEKRIIKTTIGYRRKHLEGIGENNEDNNTSLISSKDIVEKTHDTNSLEIKKIVDYLNKKADKNFKSSSSATKKHINARLNEGFTFDDFVVVIDAKVAEWKDDKTMMKYIRPETLFGGKFDGYLNENTKKRKEQKESNSKGFNLDSFHDDL